MTFTNTLFLITAICTALMAGLFFSFSCSVVLGLKLVPDSTYILMMQSINRAIQNPVFFMVFLGALILLPVNAYINYAPSPTTRFWLFLSSAIVYLIGVFCVTAFGNIPLNNTLEKFTLLNASAETIKAERLNFEGQWNRLNLIRTMASILSLVLLIIGCINLDKND